MGTVYDNPALFLESLSAVTATNTVDLGTVRYDGGNRFVYCYMAADTPDSAVVGYAVALASNNSGYSVSLSMTTGDMIHGVITKATLTTSCYGWVQVSGRAKITPQSGGCAQLKKLIVTGSGSFRDYQSYMLGLTSGGLGGIVDFAPTVVGFSLGSAVTNTSILAAIKPGW
jgi:hypothetical protein